jgi:hypothetical protein
MALEGSPICGLPVHTDWAPPITVGELTIPLLAASQGHPCVGLVHIWR